MGQSLKQVQIAIVHSTPAAQCHTAPASTAHDREHLFLQQRAQWLPENVGLGKRAGMITKAALHAASAQLHGEADAM